MNLEELKALCEEATPGPWESFTDMENTRYLSALGEMEVLCKFSPAREDSEANANFIVAARTALPKLIAIVEEVLAIEDPVLGDRVAENLVKQGKYSMLIKVRKIINNTLEES